MKRLRSIIFWAHLVTGLLVALVVLLMSVTGVLLTYQRQVTHWADTRGLDGGPPAAGAQRLTPEALLARIPPGQERAPTALRWRADADAPAEVVFGREKTLFVNAYTGQVLGTGSESVRGFFKTVVGLHRWLALEGDRRDLGKAVTGAGNLAFLFIVVSGLYLWWPRNWTRAAVRSVVLFRGGLGGKARDFNWHNVIGFWSFVPLFVIVLSGVVISYPWASDLVYRVTGDTPPGGRGGGGGPGRGGPGAGAPVAAAAPSTPLSLDVLHARALRQADDWRILTLQLPEKPDAPVVFSIDRGDGGQPQKRAQLSLHRATGQVVLWEPFSSNTSGRRLRSILRFAHTGEVLGIPGQTLAGLVTLGSVILVWTGVALSLRRFVAWRGRRRRPAPPTAPRARTAVGST